MRIIHSGGVDAWIDPESDDYSTNGYGNYFMVQIKNELDTRLADGERIAVVVAAKPNKNHFDERFKSAGFNIDDFIILGQRDTAEWEAYNAVLLLGGSTKNLYKWLTKNSFSIESLTNCTLLAGDSAGAYVLGKHTMIDYTPDGTRLKIIDGFIPHLNILVAGHINNVRYHTPDLSRTIAQWCSEHSVEYVALRENQMVSRKLDL